MFPTELPHRLIRMFSFPGETVLDPFVGSGTTVREAMNLGRVGVGYEINPEFESAIRKRLALPDPAQMALFEGADQEQVLFLRSGELEPPLLAPKDPMEPMTVASTLGELLAVEATPVIEEVPAALEPLQAAEPGPEALTPTGAAHPDNGIKRNPNPRAFRSVVSLEDAQKRVVPGVKVKEILGPNLILLADGKRISFLGLEPRPGAEEGVMEYLNEVILGQSVELKNLTESTVEGEPARAFVYLLNKTFVNARLVKMGFFVPDGTQHRHTKRFEKFAEEVRAFLEEEMGMTDEDEFDAGALGTGALDAELVDQP